MIKNSPWLQQQKIQQQAPQRRQQQGYYWQQQQMRQQKTQHQMRQQKTQHQSLQSNWQLQGLPVIKTSDWDFSVYWEEDGVVVGFFKAVLKIIIVSEILFLVLRSVL